MPVSFPGDWASATVTWASSTGYYWEGPEILSGWECDADAAASVHGGVPTDAVHYHAAAPTSTHTRALMSGSLYAEDASGPGSYHRIELPRFSGATRWQHVLVRFYNSLSPTGSHTRTLMSGTKYGEDAGGPGAYLVVWWTIDTLFALGYLFAHCEAEAAFTAAPPGVILHCDADAYNRFLGIARSFWECDAVADSSFSGRVTEWHVSGLRMDADAGCSFTGHPTGVGTLYCDADAGGQIWPRLRAIPEKCLGADTEPVAGESAEISNYVF